ncbi:BspA family leucine-rich repeat surface protein [Enterococcus thailandicus]|uniref:BspA family leucine-rich repeat surface protein n=1 Tax=Enterococcus thailandicus TaxID=417368 RepID=UPI0022E8B50F|nr:BspA family leucine-rich repeat surface protein [Enterococcus thailandicus]
MKRKILIATILSTLVLPINVSYAAENEELLEETMSSELLDETQESQLIDDEPITEFEEDIEIEELQKIDDTESSESNDSNNVEKEDPTEDLNFQDRNVNVIDSGQNTGGMKWVLYEDGLLELGGGRWALRNTNWDNYKSQVTSIKIIDTISPSDGSDGGFYEMFSHLTNLENIEGLENLKTEDAVSFNSMFYGCSSLKMIDLSSINTSKAKYMKLMFAGCRSLETLELSNFDTKNVEDFDSMFSECYKLSSLDLSSFNTENSKKMEGMFAYCINLQEIDLSSFNTAKVTNMNFMFAHCRSLKNLDLNNFNTVNVTGMANMFFYTWGLEKIDLNSFDVRNVINFDGFMEQAKTIKTLDLSNFVTESCTTAIGAFANMDSLESLHIPRWNTLKSINDKDFFKNTPLKKISIGENFKMYSNMSLRDLSSNEVWVDLNNEELSTINLIDYHNNTGMNNFYHVENQYTLTFDANGGSEISRQRSIAGKTWSVPDTPEKDGYIFDYWSIDPEGNKPYDFSIPVSGSLTLYAQYTPAYIVSIPASVNLNETNQLKVSAENYQEGKNLIVSTDEKVTLINTRDSTRILEKEITKEKEYTEPTHVLEVLSTKKEENTLYVQQTAEEELAGTYEGILNFTIDFY